MARAKNDEKLKDEFFMPVNHPKAGAPEPGGQGGQLPTQLLDPYVLSHATSFLSLFSACPPSSKLLPRPLFINYVRHFSNF